MFYSTRHEGLCSIRMFQAHDMKVYVVYQRFTAHDTKVYVAYERFTAHDTKAYEHTSVYTHTNITVHERLYSTQKFQKTFNVHIRVYIQAQMSLITRGSIIILTIIRLSSKSATTYNPILATELISSTSISMHIHRTNIFSF